MQLQKDKGVKRKNLTPFYIVDIIANVVLSKLT